MVIQPMRRRYWLHALLFLATIFTTLCIGARMQYSFDHNLGLFSQDLDFWPWQWVLQDWHRLLLGVPFSACILGILTAHELGHYVLCVRRGVLATLPFFIPAPTLIGTVGAFIRIKSPIRSRADLFDIGIAGPIAGFVVAVPVLIFALLASKPLTGEAAAYASGNDSLTLGLPLIFKLTALDDGRAGQPRSFDAGSCARLISASHGDGGVGWPFCYLAELIARRPVGWRTYHFCPESTPASAHLFAQHCGAASAELVLLGRMASVGLGAALYRRSSSGCALVSSARYQTPRTGRLCADHAGANAHAGAIRRPGIGESDSGLPRTAAADAIAKIISAAKLD